MVFSVTEATKLLDAWMSDKMLNIKGMSVRGEKFEVTGKISVNDNGEPAVYEDFVMFEFGKRDDKIKVGRNRSKCYAPYCLNIKGSDKQWAQGLLILEVADEEGNVLFSNPNVKALEEEAQEIRKNYEERQKEKGTALYGEDDPVTAKLKTMIGHPVVLDGCPVVAYSVDGCNLLNGATMVSVAVGPLVGGLSIAENAKLVVEDKDGNREFIENDSAKSRKIFQERRLQNDRYLEELEMENE